MAELLTLHFDKSGLHTTVQDLGRQGYQPLGIPSNGVMDHAAAKVANWLVDNPEDYPVLEITLIGPQIRFEGTGQIAITGANLSHTLNGDAAPAYETIDIQSGDELRFGRPVAGCRAYLAINGAWNIAPWLGSYSASAVKPGELTPESLIEKGSKVAVVPGQSIEKRAVPAEQRPNLSNIRDIRVLPGPEFSQLSNLSIASFFSQDFKISNDSNRMGYRLQGAVQGFNPKNEVISSGIIPGTIQLTNAGEPIILLADAQTSGGYFRLANVIAEDLDKLAQLKPGDEIRFRLS